MIKIRFAKKKDTKRILEMYNSSPNMGYGNSKDPGYNEKEIIEYIVKKGNRMFILQEDNEIVGALLAEFHCDYVYLHTIVIDNKCRGKGYGEMLMRKLEEIAKKEKKEVIEGVTYKKDLPMQKVFAKLNYKRGKDFVSFQKFL